MDVLFYDTFRHAGGAADRVDEVCFGAPVLVRAAMAVEAGATLHGHLISLRGETSPAGVLVEVFALGGAEQDRFERLCEPRLLSDGGNGPCPLKAVVTDHLVVRGTYERLSLIVYGTRQQRLQHGHAAAAGLASADEDLPPFIQRDSDPSSPGLAGSPRALHLAGRPPATLDPRGRSTLRSVWKEWAGSRAPCSAEQAQELLAAATAAAERSRPAEDGGEAVADHDQETAAEEEGFVEMALSWLQQLLPPRAGRIVRVPIEGYIGAFAAMQLLCESPRLCQALAAGGGLSATATILGDRAAAEPALPHALAALGRAARQPAACVALLSCMLGSNTSNSIYNVLLAAVLSLTPKRRLVSPALGILRRLQAHHLCSGIQLAGEAAIEGGPLAARKAKKIARLLRALLAVLKGRRGDKQGGAQMLKIGIIAAPDDEALLPALQDWRTLPLLAALLASPAVGDSLMLRAAVYSFILYLLASTQGLVLLAYEKEATSALLGALALPKENMPTGALPLRQLTALLAANWLPDGRHLAGCIKAAMAALGMVDELLLVKRSNHRHSLKLLWGLSALARSTAGRQAVLAALASKEVTAILVNNVCEPTSKSEGAGESRDSESGAASGAVGELSAQLLLHRVADWASPASLALWSPHASHLHRHLAAAGTSSEPVAAVVGTRARLGRLFGPCEALQREGLPALLRLAASLLPSAASPKLHDELLACLGLLATICIDPVVAGDAYSEGAVALVQQLLQFGATSIAGLPALEGQGEEKQLVRMLLPALVLLLRILQHLAKATQSHYRNSKLLNALLSLLHAMGTRSSFHARTRAGDMGALRVCLAAALACWPIHGWLPALLPRLLPPSARPLAPAHACAELALLGDFLPGADGEEGSGQGGLLAAASLLGHWTAKDLARHTCEPDAGALLRALLFHAPVLAARLRVLDHTNIVAYQQAVAFVIGRATAASVELGATLVTALVPRTPAKARDGAAAESRDSLNGEPSSTAQAVTEGEPTPTHTSIQKLHLARLLNVLAVQPAAKEVMLQCGDLVTWLIAEVALQPWASSGQQPLQQAAASSMDTLLWLTCVQVLQHLSDASIAQDVPSREMAPEDMLAMGTALLQALQRMSAGDAVQQILAALQRLASTEAGRASIVQIVRTGPEQFGGTLARLCRLAVPASLRPALLLSVALLGLTLSDLGHSDLSLTALRALLDWPNDKLKLEQHPLLDALRGMEAEGGAGSAAPASGPLILQSTVSTKQRQAWQQVVDGLPYCLIRKGVDDLIDILQGAGKLVATLEVKDEDPKPETSKGTLAARADKRIKLWPPASVRVPLMPAGDLVEWECAALPMAASEAEQHQADAVGLGKRKEGGRSLEQQPLPLPRAGSGGTAATAGGATASTPSASATGAPHAAMVSPPEFRQRKPNTSARRPSVHVDQFMAREKVHGQLPSTTATAADVNPHPQPSPPSPSFAVTAANVGSAAPATRDSGAQMSHREAPAANAGALDHGGGSSGGGGGGTPAALGRRNSAVLQPAPSPSELPSPWQQQQSQPAPPLQLPLQQPPVQLLLPPQHHSARPPRSTMPSPPAPFSPPPTSMVQPPFSGSPGVAYGHHLAPPFMPSPSHSSPWIPGRQPPPPGHVVMDVQPQPQAMGPVEPELRPRPPVSLPLPAAPSLVLSAQDSEAALGQLLANPGAMQELLQDQGKLQRLLEQHPKLMSLLQARLSELS
eukprot:SM000170S02687  [mRNA]  locus=s170:217475:229947:+ [translate_table: standard]